MHPSCPAAAHPPGGLFLTKAVAPARQNIKNKNNKSPPPTPYPPPPPTPTNEEKTQSRTQHANIENKTTPRRGSALGGQPPVVGQGDVVRPIRRCDLSKRAHAHIRGRTPPARPSESELEWEPNKRIGPLSEDPIELPGYLASGPNKYPASKHWRSKTSTSLVGQMGYTGSEA